MGSFLAQAAKLDNQLLASDEKEYDEIATDIAQHLIKTPEQDTGKLEDLDASHQTILFLFNLSNQIDASIKSGKAANKQLPASLLPEGRLWPFITTAILQFNPIQVRYAGQYLIKILDIVTRGAEQSGNYVPAIQLLESTIVRLDPASSTLTSTHHAYVRLCLLARAYSQAVTILDQPIYSIPSPDISKQVGSRAIRYLCSVQESSATYLTTSTRLTQRVTSRMYLEYFLYGAMCYMGVGLYEKALAFLEIVLTIPNNQGAASFIQLEAFKKWSLINLLVHGSSKDVPRSISTITIRNLRAAAKPYECLVDAFRNGKIDKLEAEIQEGMEVWQEDENYGLVHEVVASFRKHAVLRLAKTYAALPIDEVASLASSGTVDVATMTIFVESLINTGQLQATLVQSEDGKPLTVRCASDQAVPMSEQQVEKEMISRTRELQTLLKSIGKLDHQMEIHKDYIEYLQKLRNARNRNTKSETAGNKAFQMDVQDEDMMEDL